MAFDPAKPFVVEDEESETTFDPTQPFEIEKEQAPVSGFDPTQPFEVEEQQPAPPVGTSLFEEIAAIPQALRQSIEQPTEAMGETAEVLGMPALGRALRGAVEAPEGYVPAAQRFMEPQEGEFQIGGFAPQFLPRAIVEQAGQIGGAILTRAAGAAIGGLAGSTVGPKGTVAGAVAGSFLGPALFEMSQIVGPVARERAANQGREEPTTDDLAWAWSTAGASGALNAIGAKYLPNGDKLVGGLANRIATAVAGEGTTEGLQSVVQQTGQTFLTEQGLEIKPKEAIGEALIGGGAGGAAVVAAAPFTSTPEAKAAAAADTKVAAEQAAPVAPETAQVVSEQANQVIAQAQAEETAETPDERVARLQREAQEAAGEIELEEEGAGLPPEPVTPTPEAPPVEPAAPVEPVVAAEGARPPVTPEVVPKAENAVVESEQKSEQESDTVKVFRGVAEAGALPTGGAFFTDSERDASAYAQLAALRKATEENEDFNDIVSEVMAEEGANDITDLSINTIKSIIEGNNIQVGDISEGAVLRGNIRLGNVLNLESFGSEVGSLPETWNELNELGLVPETWESLDEDVQEELSDKYRGKAFYSLLEGEVNLNDQFAKGIDTIVFTDQNTEGKGTHRTYLTKAAEQFAPEAAPAAVEPTLVTPPVTPEAPKAEENASQKIIRAATSSGLIQIKPREEGALRGFYTLQAQEGGTKIAFSYGTTLAEAAPNELTIEAIYTPPQERGTGAASKLLQNVLNIADQEGITLKLEPVAISDLAQEGEQFLTKRQLASWYKRYGFEQAVEGSDELLVRTPSPQPQDVGQEFTVYRGELPALEGGRQLAGIRDIGEVVGLPDIAPLAPFTYYSTSERDARGYLERDARILKDYQDRFGVEEGLKTFQSLHGFDPRTEGQVVSKKIRPRKIFDITEMGTTADIFKMYELVAKEMGYTLPENWKWKDVPIEVTEEVSRYGLDMVGDPDNKQPTWQYFRNDMNRTKASLIQQGARERSKDDVRGSLFAQWLRKNGYDAVAMMHDTESEGPVKHILVINEEVAKAQEGLAPEAAPEPRRVARIEPSDIETAVVPEEAGDVFANLVRRKQEVQPAVLQKPVGSQFQTPEEFRAAFDLRGQGHTRFAIRLDLMQEDGAITEDGKNLILATIWDNNTNDEFLSNMEMGSARKNVKSYGYGGRSRQTVEGGRVEQKPLLELIRATRRGGAEIDKRTALTLNTFWHEFGHAGYYSLLDAKQKKAVDDAYNKTTRAGRRAFFAEGKSDIENTPWFSKYYAKNQSEWFAQSFAEYVITQKSDQKKLVPVFEQLLDKIKAVFTKLFNRKEQVNLNDIFDFILRGEAYGQRPTWQGYTMSTKPAVYGTPRGQAISPEFTKRLLEREGVSPQDERRQQIIDGISLRFKRSKNEYGNNEFKTEYDFGGRSPIVDKISFSLEQFDDSTVAIDYLPSKGGKYARIALPELERPFKGRAAAERAIKRAIAEIWMDERVGGAEVAPTPEVREARREPTITPQQDRDYLDAVERGDSGTDNLSVLLRASKAEDRPSVYQQWAERNPKAAESLQRVVDAAAKVAGFRFGPVFHGTKELFNIFRSDKYEDKLIYFSEREQFSREWARGRKPRQEVLDRINKVRAESKEYVDGLFEAEPSLTNNERDLAIAAKHFEKQKEFERQRLDGMTVSEAQRDAGIRLVRAYLKADNIFDPAKNWREFLPQILTRLGITSESEIEPSVMKGIQDGNYLIWEDKNVMDAVLSKYDAIRIQETSGGPADTIAVRDPAQIKLADPVTYDDQGNIIPLSQRFQPEQADIRYARREQQLSNSLDSGDFVSAQALVDGGATMDRATFLRSITPSATQRATTIHTRLERDGIISKDEFANEQGLVYGDGRGAASAYLGAESYEPFPPAGFAPDYSGDRVAGQGAPIDKKFRTILNTFVLNVVDPQTRSFIVKDIANLLENGGRAVFVTRGKDVANSQALVSFGPLERIQRSEGKLTYQKGFTQPELIQYIQETLGDGFEVRALRGGSASDVRVEVVKKTDATLDNPPIVPEARERRRVQMGRAGMETSAVEARLQELGFPTGGIIRVVNEPDADFEGRTIILDGKVTGIELNAAAMRDNATIDRVLNHEFAESANADGALNRLVERLTPKEKKEINDTITRLRYEERARTSEEAARAIETLAEAWKGRGFFTRAVARVEAWASKLGFKLTRRAAEYIAARNLADINEGFKTAYNQFINVTGDERLSRAYKMGVPTQEELDARKARLPKYTVDIRQPPAPTEAERSGRWATIEIMEPNGRSVGRAIVVVPNDGDTALTIQDTIVYRQFRGLGYGEALYREVAKFAQQNGMTSIFGGIVSEDAQRVRRRLFETKYRDVTAVDNEGYQQVAMESNVNPDIRYARREVRESRREPEAIPTFTEGTPEAATLKEMEASMAKVDAASEAKGGKPETYKISEIASVWMDSGLGERELQDAIVEYTNLTPANAAKVAKAISKQYGLQQQIAETGAVIAEIAPEPEGAPRKSAVTKLIEQTTGVRKPVVKLQVSESAALKKQIQLKAREARETRKARKEAAEDLAKAITDYVKANPIRGPINSRQAMSITKKALKLDVNNEAAVDRFEMYVERVIENANYDRDLSDARSLIKRAKAFAKAKVTQGNVKDTLEAIANISPTLLDNPFEFNLVVQRYLLGLAPVTAKQYAVMPDADVRRYLESLETQIKDNQEVLDRAKAQRILDKQAAYAEEKGIPLDEAIAILNSEEFLQEKTIEKLEDLTKLLTAMAQESQKDVKAYDDAGATPKQKELISFMRKVNIDSLINEEKKRYIRFANNLLANGATFGMEQFQSIALGQEAAMKAVKDRRLSQKLAAWISPIGGDKAIDTARRIALRTQSEADTFKNIFGREAVGAFRNILGLNRLDVAQTDSNRAKEQIANEFGEYFKGLRKKYGDDATGFEAKGYAGIAGYLIQTDGNKTEAESIPYRRRLMEQNIAELRKSDKQSDLAEADLKEKALAQLTGTTNAEILSQLQALNPASYEQLMWVKDVMLPKWRDFLKEHDENFRNQANNYNNPDHLTITYKFPEGQLLPNEIEDVYQQDMVGMRIKQAANSIKRKDHPNLPVSKAGTIANIDINFGYNQYNALVDQVDKAYVAPAWEQVVAFTKDSNFEQIMGGRANALFVKNLLRDIQTSRSRQSITDDEAQLIAGGVRLARKISTQAVLGGITQPLRQVPDQLAKLFFTTGRFDLITKNLLTTAQAAPLLNKFPIGRRGDAQAGTQYASQFSELARKVEASVTDRKWAKYRELMNKVGEFWMTPLRGSDVWAAKVSWMSYYEAELNKKGIKMESWEREAELVDTDQDRKEAASYAEFAVDFYGGASDPTKMASLSKQTNNGWKEFAKLVFLPLNSFALQQKNSLISDLRDAYLRTGDRKASIAAIAGTLAGMAAFHGMRIYIIGGLIYPAGKALLMGIFGIDMDEPDEEEKQKKLEDDWRKFKASMYGNIIAGGAGEFAEKAAIDAVNKATYLIQANVNPDELLNDKGEVMSFRQYEKDMSPLYRFRSFGTSEYSFGLADVLTEQAQRSLVETQQLLTPEEMERYTGNEQAYAMFSTMVEWLYFFRLMDTDATRIVRDLKRQMDKEVIEREKELKRIREGR